MAIKTKPKAPAKAKPAPKAPVKKLNDPRTMVASKKSTMKSGKC